MILRNLFKKFKKKPEAIDLLQAKNLGLITQEEFFRLTLSRAENNLKEYIGKNERIKKVKK